MSRKSPVLLLSAVAAALFAAGAPSAMAQAAFDQSMLPDAVKVPAGHKVAMETVGVGQITQREPDPRAALGPLDLMAAAAKAAGASPSPCARCGRGSARAPDSAPKWHRCPA